MRACEGWPKHKQARGTHHQCTIVAPSGGLDGLARLATTKRGPAFQNLSRRLPEGAHRAALPPCPPAGVCVCLRLRLRLPSTPARRGDKWSPTPGTSRILPSWTCPQATAAPLFLSLVEPAVREHQGGTHSIGIWAVRWWLRRTTPGGCISISISISIAEAGTGHGGRPVVHRRKRAR